MSASACEPIERRLAAFDPRQARWVSASAALVELLPFTRAASHVRAVAPGVQRLPRECRLSMRDAQGQDHLQLDLAPGTLASLGLPAAARQRLTREQLLALLLPSLQPLTTWAAAALAQPLTVHAQIDDPSESAPSAKARAGAPVPSGASGNPGAGAVAGDSTDALPWCFRVEGLEPLAAMQLSVSARLLNCGPLLPRRRPARSRLLHQRIGWSLCWTVSAVKLFELGKLSPGDVLPCAWTLGADRPTRLQIASRSCPPTPGLQFDVEVSIDAFGVVQVLLPPMNPTSPTMDAPPDLDALAVPVELRAPLIALSLAEIEGAAPGTLIDTGHSLQTLEVELSSAGQVFAVGRLVALGDKLGVEVLRLLPGSAT